MGKTAIKRYSFWMVILLFFAVCNSISQTENIEVVIRPVEIDDLLTNPGIGFMTFQRFNGDALNEGSDWTEGFPIDYQKFEGDLTNVDHPATTIAYWRIYWRFMEPEQGKYRWDMLDMALDTARSRGQTLLLRIAPYGTGDESDVPDWYRKMVGLENDWKYNRPVNKWVVNPEDPRYAEYFGRFIRAMGERYDGHPDLEAVDLSIVGAWGEGAGSELLSQHTREALVNSYTDSFRKTPLIALLMDKETNMYANSQIPVGWRVDCIGDLGFGANKNWTHMYDFYPQAIIDYNVKDDWKTSPLSFEICGTFRRWKDREGYDRDDVRYIFNETLKWHISSFNAKSSPVPEEWQDLVDDWLKKMGYRFVLKRFSYPDEIQQNGKFPFKSWWENKGVAPCYKDFTLAIRLKSKEKVSVFPTDAIIKDWLPGDNVYDNSVFIPNDLPVGVYDVQLAIVDRWKFEPRVKLAIKGRGDDGWYQLGQIRITGQNENSDSNSIKPYPENPRYWQYKGNPVLLLGGSGDDNLFQYPGLEEHLDLLQSVGGNFIRNTMSSRDSGNYWPFYLQQDGNYDLERWDEAYWSRFESLLKLAHERDIIIQIEVWDRFDFSRDPWKANPFNPANNVNYTDKECGMEMNYPEHPARDEQPFFHSVPDMPLYTPELDIVRKYQENFVDKMLSYSLSYGNVLYCMNNETNTPIEWGKSWMKHIRGRAGGKEIFTTDMFGFFYTPQTCDLCIDAIKNPEEYDFLDVSQINLNFNQSNWDTLSWIIQQRDLYPLRPVNCVKVYGGQNSSWGSGANEDGIERFVREVIGGCAAVRHHRPLHGNGLNAKSQASIQSVRKIETMVKMWEMEPHMELLSDREDDEAYLTAKRGEKYVILFPDGGNVTLDLTDSPGEFSGRWISIESGAWEEHFSLNGGSLTEIGSPGSGGWFAVITRK